MAKTINFNIDENSFQAFGINTILKDYQLCSLINDFYKLESKLLDSQNLNIDISVFGDTVDDLKVLLIQNQSHKNNIFTKLDAFDYIVVIDNIDEEISEIIHSLESNNDILYVSKIAEKFFNKKDKALINQLLNKIQ